MEIGKRTGGKAYRQNQSLKKFIRKRDNHTCQLCGAEGWIVDHILPWRVSHNSTVSNLRVLCHKCNLVTRRQRKDTKLPLAEWYPWLEQELGLTAKQ